MEEHGIGWAVKQLHNGAKVRRAGWNGKGMWLVLVPGSHVPLRDGTPYAKVLRTATQDQSHVTIGAHIEHVHRSRHDAARLARVASRPAGGRLGNFCGVGTIRCHTEERQMKLNEAYFVSTEPTKALSNAAWSGYLEAGKAYGSGRDRYLAGTPHDLAYKRGWDKRTAETEAA